MFHSSVFTQGLKIIKCLSLWALPFLLIIFEMFLHLDRSRPVVKFTDWMIWKVSPVNIRSHTWPCMSGQNNCLQRSQTGLNKYTNLENILVFLNFFPFPELNSRINDPMVMRTLLHMGETFWRSTITSIWTLYQREQTEEHPLPAWDMKFSGLTNFKLSGLNYQHHVWRKPLSKEPKCLHQCNDCFFIDVG